MTSKFINPLCPEASLDAGPCLIVIFGVTGDLTHKKLLPAIYNLKMSGHLHPNTAIVGFARRPKTDSEFRSDVKAAVQKYSRTGVDETQLDIFLQQFYYFQSEFEDQNRFHEFHTFLDSLHSSLSTKGNVIFYLSVQASYFTSIVKQLHTAALIHPHNDTSVFSRVIIEKPFGRDSESALALQQALTQYLDESQIYRIDHYLGKETVQNILVFRFSNIMPEAIWNREYVDSVQITFAEDIGIGSRGNFYEETGLVRDILQSHMMQVLALIAMEPPNSLAAKAIRDEKVKVIESIRPFNNANDIANSVVRGQYAPGFISGQSVQGYRQEANVNPNSSVETYCAMKVYIDNLRWYDVPFYLRAGKCLAKRVSEVTIQFKQLPAVLSQSKHQGAPTNNSITLRIQPYEMIKMMINAKVPGQPCFQTVGMEFDYESYFGAAIPEAYERLIYDCIIGDSTLFARFDETYYSWQLFTPLLNAWASEPLKSTEFYPAGSWGPAIGDDLLHHDHRSWKKL